MSRWHRRQSIRRHHGDRVPRNARWLCTGAASQLVGWGDRIPGLCARLLMAPRCGSGVPHSGHGDVAGNPPPVIPASDAQSLAHATVLNCLTRGRVQSNVDGKRTASRKGQEGDTHQPAERRCGHPVCNPVLVRGRVKPPIPSDPGPFNTHASRQLRLLRIRSSTPGRNGRRSDNPDPGEQESRSVRVAVMCCQRDYATAPDTNGLRPKP